MDNRCLPALLILLLAAGLFAQEQTEKSYFIDESSGTPRFMQRLSWYPEEYVSRYEVCIEELLPGPAGVEPRSRREILRQSTEADHLDVSLAAGSYRYRVQSYDLFDKPAEDPPWIEFVVLPALRPELLALEPDVLPSGQPGAFTVRGRNLEAGARVILRNRKNGREQAGEFLAGPGGGSGAAAFSSPLASGTYDVIVENPGGLSGSLGPLTVLSPRINYYVSAGYEPMFPLYGQLNEMLDARLYPLGVYARFGLMPFEWNGFDFGIEAAAGWNYFWSDYSSGGIEYEVTGHLANLRVHLAAQRRFSGGRLALMLRGGGGLASAIDFKKQRSGLKTEAVNALFPAGSAGFSALWYFSETWFVTLGLEYLHLFSADERAPGYLLPFAGIGLNL